MRYVIRQLVLLSVVWLLIFVVAGCGGGGGSVGVNNPTVKPSSLPFAGGTVVVTADIVGINSGSVVADITLSGSPNPIPVGMTPVSGNTYSASYNVPANLTIGQAQIYSVQVLATDESNHTWRSSVCSFRVAASSLPPPPIQTTRK